MMCERMLCCILYGVQRVPCAGVYMCGVCGVCGICGVCGV